MSAFPQQFLQSLQQCMVLQHQTASSLLVLLFSCIKWVELQFRTFLPMNPKMGPWFASSSFFFLEYSCSTFAGAGDIVRVLPVVMAPLLLEWWHRRRWFPIGRCWYFMEWKQREVWSGWRGGAGWWRLMKLQFEAMRNRVVRVASGQGWRHHFRFIIVVVHVTVSSCQLSHFNAVRCQQLCGWSEGNVQFWNCIR